MRRKSIGATSQAFHEPMSSGAFLEFLTGMQGSGELYSSAFGNHPTPPKVSGLGVMTRTHGFETQQEVKNLACRKSVRVAGSRPQGPVGQVSRGLGARAPRAWGPAHQGAGAFSPQKPPKPRFFRKPPGGSLATAETAASEVGTWRETKPGYPPYPHVLGL